MASLASLRTIALLFSTHRRVLALSGRVGFALRVLHAEQEEPERTSGERTWRRERRAKQLNAPQV
jgi:hypothetical protein